MKGKRDFSGLKKLAPFLKTYRGMFAAMIVCTVLVGVFNTILPLFQQYAFDNFIANDTLEGLAPFIVLYILCLLVTMVLDYVASFDCCKLEMYLLRDMRRAAFNHLQTLSVSYFSANSVGRVHARVMSDTSAIGSIISWDVYQGGWNVTYVISAVIIMLALNPLLALCVIVVVPLVAVASCYFQRRLTVLNRRVREINSEITGGFNEGITGVQTAKTLAIEDRLDARFSRNTARMHRQGTKLGHNRALFYSIIAFASSAALALVLWYGGVLTAENAVKLGTLTVFMTYAQGIMSPVQWSVDAIADLIAVKVNAERLSALLSTESDVKDTPEVTAKYGDTFDPKRENWEPLYGDVEFRDVTFRYPDGEENVLEHFNLKHVRRSPQGHARSHSRRDGRGQVYPGKSRVQVLRTDGGTGAHRRPRRARTLGGLAAQPHRLRVADAAPVLGHSARKSSVRQRDRHAGAARRGVRKRKCRQGDSPP